MDDDLVARQRDGAVDAGSAARLDARGLQLRLVPHQRPAFDGWLQATARGFLDSERTEEQLAASFDRSASHRRIGVYDPTAPQDDVPVGTFETWVAELALPGDVVVPALAVSSVTVSPTHAGRGIARAMMEGELRHASRLGIPLAALTVSESTLYGRYGFGQAAAATTWTIETRRAGWIGPEVSGRVDYITRELARTLAPGLHARILRSRPGELAMPGSQWGQFTGTEPDAEKPGSVRAVQYANAAGEVRGLALYTVTENHDDYTKSTARVRYLLAADDEAYAGLWRFLLSLPLISTLTASELSTDEPLLWMIADQRAVRMSVTDHHYVRILDVPAVLGARRYPGAGQLVLEVTDPLGLSEGRWLLESSDDGTAGIVEADGVDTGEVPTMTLGTTELSALCLGGVSPATLAAAGRIRTTDAAASSRLFGWHVSPRLSFWY
ncbi:GNAT family N-acetyltransferase [Microbacterium protaetiae]|uniref:GNAT family N-acetyltransferase n=1 Tax=Microbacterium protaetiae TaxID=2509458 RepID=A0A4P6ESC3_9MICO|nr:GNAT family N-acetyltransferase [Microbacterium protaetiae]QAY60868.1 GNAT family N-acetyltransferase [Microbacterium protaetiae]